METEHTIQRPEDMSTVGSITDHRPRGHGVFVYIRTGRENDWTEIRSKAVDDQGSS
ncbi:hypothetical protein K0M31_000201 [Melipona bicolor]|uniref:Uncharacterized protein n=1 Tax=Melipona bicolor TaxID=60889 RepID=A0AA40GD10_9HYME|nr:hypothetical protein K0M31_000201 [Melipona bicolor]